MMLILKKSRGFKQKVCLNSRNSYVTAAAKNLKRKPN